MLSIALALVLLGTAHPDTTVTVRHHHTVTTHHSRHCHPCGKHVVKTTTKHTTSDNVTAPNTNGAVSEYGPCGEPGATVGAFVSRDAQDGPTLLGLEVMGRSGPLGLRIGFAGGDNLDRTTVDGLLFYCAKPVSVYGGLGVVSDCVQARHASATVKRDPPSLLVGVETLGDNTVFGEFREVFGDNDHSAISIGLRHRL